MRRLGVLTAALLASACSSAQAPQRTPVATPGATPVARLGAALSDMYSNQYTAAQREFVAVIATTPHDAVAVASFALFLNYAGRQDTARSEAGLATALAPQDGYAFAILCRVEDWSAQYEAAVADGKRAVELAATEPLAHLFLAEALADTGRLTESQAEIDAARALITAHPTSFLQAELAREQGNLAGDRGDDSGKAAHLKAASAQQPGWLYRTTEVVDALEGANDDTAARQLLAATARTPPDDVMALALLGNEAISVGDASLAAGIWSRAAALAPSDATILDVAGEVAVAANHDNNAAITDFQAALRADPTDIQAAAYLEALARYVQHDPAAGQREITQAVAASAGPRGGSERGLPMPDVRASADAQRALADVNSARRAAGLAAVQLDPHLTASADSHSFYWLFNNLSSTVGGLRIHQETPGFTGFSGGFPWTRAVAFGYPNQRVGEDIDHRGDPRKAVDEWVNSVFHRFAILRADLVSIGYGEAYVGPVLMEDLEFGFGSAVSSAPVVYPGAGQGDVPAIFVDNELPDPVPKGQPRTTGSPVTVTFSAGASVQVASFSLQDSAGTQLGAYSGPPSGATENSAWLLPKSPLNPSSTYTAHIVATIDGQSFDRAWSFTTAA